MAHTGTTTTKIGWALLPALSLWLSSFLGQKIRTERHAKKKKKISLKRRFIYNYRSVARSVFGVNIGRNFLLPLLGKSWNWIFLFVWFTNVPWFPLYMKDRCNTQCDFVRVAWKGEYRQWEWYLVLAGYWFTDFDYLMTAKKHIGKIYTFLQSWKA